MKAVRRVVKQLPVEMIKQCLSVSSCMQMCTVMDEHYTACQHSMPFVLNGPMQFFECFSIHCDIILVPCCMNSTFPVPETSCHQLSGISLFNFFGLFGECMCIHCFDCFLASTSTNKTLISLSVTHMLWLRNTLPSSCHCSKKSKPKPFSVFSVHTPAFSEPILCKTCDSMA
jgi:hypothetical protein